MTSGHIDRFIAEGLPPPQDQPEFLFVRPELRYPERFNCAVELIDRAPRDDLALVNDGGEWTYGEMADCSNRIARLLVEREGLVSGNRVLLRGPNTATMFAAWLGVIKAGGIVVATMPMLRGKEIATILDRAEVSHAIIDARFAADFDEACGRAARAPRTISYDGDVAHGDLAGRMADIPTDFVACDTHRDDVALIAFTSGTTGQPKACVHFHRDVLACADSFARHVLKPGPGDRWACSAPLAFTFGLGMELIFPWRFGGTAVTIETPGPAALLDAIERHHVTVLGTAPTAYKAMIPLLAGREIASLKSCVSAGEHLPAATWLAWREATGIGIVDGIGATEMMHIFISAAGDAIRPGATGRAVPGYIATVLDDAGVPLESGVGRLAVKGPTGCRYFDDERQASYVENGWNVTGDTYRLDADGYFWFVARSDDMIVSSGYNIAAPEVEGALYDHPAVGECAVVGAADPERGQIVKAFIVLAEGYGASDALVAELQAHVKATVAPYKYPRAIAFVDALPKTATGKLQRFSLRDGR
jgi:2-aminobenzoate-CoA ligase